MRPHPVVIFVALGLLPTLAAPAQAQCAPREQRVKSPGKRFEEAPVGMGLTEPGQILELFTSNAGTWTMVLTNPNGTSCLIAAGDAWNAVQRAKGTPT